MIILQQKIRLHIVTFDKEKITISFWNLFGRKFLKNYIIYTKFCNLAKLLSKMHIVLFKLTVP